MFAIQNLGERAARPVRILRLARGQARDYARRSITFYYENELPQPQDLVEFGFTNTNPCCIRVS